MLNPHSVHAIIVLYQFISYEITIFHHVNCSSLIKYKPYISIYIISYLYHLHHVYIHFSHRFFSFWSVIRVWSPCKSPARLQEEHPTLQLKRKATTATSEASGSPRWSCGALGISSEVGHEANTYGFRTFYHGTPWEKPWFYDVLVWIEDDLRRASGESLGDFSGVSETGGWGTPKSSKKGLGTTRTHPAGQSLWAIPHFGCFTTYWLVVWNIFYFPIYWE